MGRPAPGGPGAPSSTRAPAATWPPAWQEVGSSTLSTAPRVISRALPDTAGPEGRAAPPAQRHHEQSILKCPGSTLNSRGLCGNALGERQRGSESRSTWQGQASRRQRGRDPGGWPGTAGPDLADPAGKFPLQGHKCVTITLSAAWVQNLFLFLPQY